jgi:hypothetical protein
VPELLRWDSGTGKEPLFGFLLLLLANAHFEVLLFRFLEGLVIVPRYRVFQVGVDIRILRQDRHQSEMLIASWTKWPEAFYIRDRHS